MKAPRFQRSHDVVARAIGAETILVPMGNRIVDLACLFTLNETGAFIWQQLAEPCTLHQLATAVAQEFAVSRAQARRDAEAFVARLVREGCAHEQPAPSAR